MRRRRSRPHLILYHDPSPQTDVSTVPASVDHDEEADAVLIGPQLLKGFEQALKPRSRGDLATWLIDGFLTGRGRGLQLRAGPMLLPQLHAAAAKIGVGHLQPLDGEDGWRRLTGLAEAVRTLMDELAAAHDPAFWYAMIMRLQPPLATFAPSIALLALPEMGAAAFRSPRRSTLLGFLTAPWRVPPKTMTRVDQLLFLGLIVANVEVARRRVGKGQQVALNQASTFNPIFDQDTDVAAAIDLYDRRLAASEDGPAAALGGFGAALGPMDSSWPMITWGSLLQQPAIRGPLLQQALQRWDPVFPMVSDLQRVVPAAFLPGSAGLTFDAQAVAVFLSAYARLVTARSAVLRLARRAWSRFGYAVRTRQEFRRTFATAAEGHPVLRDGWLSGDADTALDRLTSIGLIRPVGRRHLILNGAMAATALQHVFDRPSDGAAANVWARSFEDEVQQLIDQTPWQPPTGMRLLIGRDVKIDGQRLTDIDAVAYRDRVLLLIDCKAYKGNPRLADGEYLALKTLRDRAEKAASDWASKTATIAAHRDQLPVPVAANITVVGVVVTPFTVFVLPGPATEKVFGPLHRVSTAGELLLFLNGLRLG